MINKEYQETTETLKTALYNYIVTHSKKYVDYNYNREVYVGKEIDDLKNEMIYEYFHQ